MPRLSSALLLLLAILSLSLGSGCSDDSPSTPGPNPPDTSSTVNQKMRPVLFVHGYLEAADAWTQMSQWMTINNYPDAYLHAYDIVPGLTTLTPDLSTAAAALKSEVDALLATTQSDRVDIVAHDIGAKIVQTYINSLEGKNKVAHAIFCGGVFDAGLGLPSSPVKTLTIRSNGNDSWQQGNASAGTLAGATDVVLPNMDHLQLITSYDAFRSVMTFCTGAEPTVKIFPNKQAGKVYSMRFRVIDFFDNTPVPNATVTFIFLKPGTAEQQVPPRVFTADNNGYISMVDTLTGFDYELWVSKEATHHDSHIYRQPWRVKSKFERLRLLPKASGSTFLRSVVSAIPFSMDHAVSIIYSQNRAIVQGRDDIALRYIDFTDEEATLSLVNTGTGPSPATGTMTQYLVMVDKDLNHATGAGPISDPALNQNMISSYDVFLNAIAAGKQGFLTFNTKLMAFQNWRSGNSGGKNKGISFVQYEYGN